jgi:eukaryotic-like serine/threonine-protein kinase
MTPERMTPESWRHVGELFHEAVALPPGERTAWAVQACAGDQEILRELSSLLESDRKAREGFVHDQVKAGLVGFYEQEARAREPERAGPYRLVREIGKGGMGTVYLGRRDDQEYDIDVAVKLVTPGMDTGFVLQRFRRERQILASLDHPHIARLLDGGTIGDDVPYIVMEYVDGLRITEYYRQRQLSVEQRLRLFLDVCGAVEHAHRRFVVHRDIKPGNILVTHAGVVKLLDFGICKLLYSDPLGQDTITEAGRLMTPDYASPEQIRGEPVTVVSDVYSLAAVLYELLTASFRQPHAARNRADHLRAARDPAQPGRQRGGNRAEAPGRPGYHPLAGAGQRPPAPVSNGSGVRRRSRPAPFESSRQGCSGHAGVSRRQVPAPPGRRRRGGGGECGADRGRSPDHRT